MGFKLERDFGDNVLAAQRKSIESQEACEVPLDELPAERFVVDPEEIILSNMEAERIGLMAEVIAEEATYQILLAELLHKNLSD